MYELVLIVCLSQSECIVFRQQFPEQECIQEMKKYAGEDAKFRRAWIEGWQEGATHLKQPAYCIHLTDDY